MSGLYLHIPFCASRCGYCDFVTEAVVADDPRIDAYCEKLQLELRRAAKSGQLGDVTTIYIGGGTPSYLGNKRLVGLVYTLSLSVNLLPETEFTVEANPESLNATLVRDLYSLGVSRFSLGVQSFNDDELQTLGRAHDRQRALDAIGMACERCDNVSLDLICGIPGQSAASWRESLKTAVDLGVSHISVYPLTLEPSTPLARLAANQQLQLPDEDCQAEMMADAADYLKNQGFLRYEVASYARLGYRCQHNIAYWTGQPYLGLGRGAAGMRNTTSGRERLYEGKVVEVLSLAERQLEDLMLRMRLSDGVSQEALEKVAQFAPEITEVFSSLVADGLVKRRADCYCPTERGWLLGNQIYSRIWGLKPD